MRYRRLNWRAPLVLAAAAVGVGLLAAQAGAVSAVLANGATIALPATTAAAEPDLAGVVIHDAVIPFQVKNAAQTTVLCEGQLQDRVVRSTATNDLHFYYRFIGTPTRLRFPPTARITRIETVWFSGVDPLRAAYRTDGLGVVAPATARRPYVDTIWFVFGGGGMPCGSNSRFFFVKATGTGYKTVGETRIELTTGDFTLINNTWLPTLN